MLLHKSTFKIKFNSNISHLQEWHQIVPKMPNLYSRKGLFTIRHNSEGKTKDLHRATSFCLVVTLRGCFIRQPSVQDNHFSMVPRAVVLYRFNCISLAKQLFFCERMQFSNFTVFDCCELSLRLAETCDFVYLSFAYDTPKLLSSTSHYHKYFRFKKEKYIAVRKIY